MEEIEHNPSGIHSFLVNKFLDVEVVDLSKKRKLLDRQSSLPIRKLNFREGSSESQDSSLVVEMSEAEDIPQTWIVKLNKNHAHHVSESMQQESEMDSNSFAEESDYSISQYVESKAGPEFPKVSACDQPAKCKGSSTEVYACHKPSTSSGSCGSNSPKDMLHSLEGRNLKKLLIEAENVERLLEFGYHKDYICSDPEIGENEESLDVESEDPMMYTKGVSPDLFVLSSGRWQIDPDTQAGVRKPTIDQEFEQYFSSLML